jgi:hypothetical protein
MSRGSPIKQRDDTCHAHRPSTGRARARLIRSSYAPPRRQCLRERRRPIIPPHMFDRICRHPVAATVAIHPRKLNQAAESP